MGKKGKRSKNKSKSEEPKTDQEQQPDPQQQQPGPSQQQPGPRQQQSKPQQQQSEPQQQQSEPQQQQSEPRRKQRDLQPRQPGPSQQQPGPRRQQQSEPQQQQSEPQQQQSESQQQLSKPRRKQRDLQPRQLGPSQQQSELQQQQSEPQQQQSESQEQHSEPRRKQRDLRPRQPGPSQQQPGPSQQQPGPWRQQQPGPSQQQPGPWRQQQPDPSQEQPGPSRQQQPGPSEQQPGPWRQQQPDPSQQQPGPSRQQQPGPQRQKETAVVSQESKKFKLSKALQDSYLAQIPVKKVGGTQGRQITVEANMLRLIFPSNFATNIVHYDVNIIPDRPKALLRSVFEQFKKKQCPKRNPVFDGKKNAYSAKKLPFGNESPVEEVTIFDHEFARERTFKIYLKKVAELDLSWINKKYYTAFEDDDKLSCIQALDIILRHESMLRFVTVGRSIFQPPISGRVVSLSNGLDLWVGLFQSVVIGSKPYLNIDVAHKGFPTPQPVIDLMKELCKNPRAREESRTITPADVNHNFDKITNFLKGLKIQYELPEQPTSKRTYRVNGLVPCARENRFTLEDQTVCTVEEYFLQKKRYKIKYPDLPCLWVGSRNSNIHLPAELCTIVAGQVTQKKMDEVQVSKMIREAATDTKTRKAKIMSQFANMNLNQQPSLLNEFHFSIHGEFEKVPARVLQAPVLKYDQKEVNVFKGTWRPEKFLKACDLQENTWTILNLDSYISEPTLYQLQKNLQSGGKLLNMKIDKALTPFATLTVQRNIKVINQYFEEKKKQNIKLVVVILPNLNNAYSIVKQISELQIHGGIVTQCIKSQTVRRLNNSTVVNILLKINSKLNGVNHTLVQRPPCLCVPCMIVGADVTHPSPDSVNIPSIAAVAASHDPNAFQFNIEVRLQSPREEMIQDLEEIMTIQLKFFFVKTGYKPKKIIFYRDGVSEGQLVQLMHFELSAIKKAVMRLDKSTACNIPIAYFVVQKRHHIRLFPTSERNSDDRNFNVQAGTIVDTEITHPTHIDFYLVSHASIQGTARPTKYRCICNETMMSENEIEQLTYYLCHMFARCTRSVSYPAPTYYAHLAAFRARTLIQNVTLNLDNLREEQQRKMTLQINKNSPMFFV
ncbi:PREDICTED: protein argonaute-2 [Eufriesea mexicana]|uniref:protein argonaute-2 n=1 Tax=Eufriesea mexicana TaxID=516756 RepID=UPI00083C05FA|nr:PREDICTED: protein argonaute-2 [Eufriesea mexicana]